jgi:hypothetical protein
VITIHELSSARGGKRFLGYRMGRQAKLADAAAHELARRLVLDVSYYDAGDYGCVGNPVGIRIARGMATIDVVEDCGHLYLTAAGHEGPWVLLSSDMAAFVSELRIVFQ